jgi:hypothetical protein
VGSSPIASTIVLSQDFWDARTEAGDLVLGLHAHGGAVPAEVGHASRRSAMMFP